MRERFDALLAAEPAELVMGPVTNRIHTEMAARYQAGRARGLAALDSDRYAALLRELDAFVQVPPYAEAAALPAAEQLPRLLERDLKRLRRRADAAAAAVEAGAAERDPALHETRKAAKRVRYAAESAVPVFGKRAKSLAKRAEQVQEVLGEHQDTVVARTTLRELGAKAYLERENGFTFGRLHALEEARAARLVERYPRTLRRLPRKPVGRWLTS
jgi:CHAD domain-containing protein